MNFTIFTLISLRIIWQRINLCDACTVIGFNDKWWFSVCKIRNAHHISSHLTHISEKYDWFSTTTVTATASTIIRVKPYVSIVYNVSRFYAFLRVSKFAGIPFLVANIGEWIGSIFDLQCCVWTEYTHSAWWPEILESR